MQHLVHSLQPSLLYLSCLIIQKWFIVLRTSGQCYKHFWGNLDLSEMNKLEKNIVLMAGSAKMLNKSIFQITFTLKLLISSNGLIVLSWLRWNLDFLISCFSKKHCYFEHRSRKTSLEIFEFYSVLVCAVHDRWIRNFWFKQIYLICQVNQVRKPVKNVSTIQFWLIQTHGQWLWLSW